MENKVRTMLWLPYKLLLYTTDGNVQLDDYALWLPYKLLLYTTLFIFVTFEVCCDYLIDYYYIQLFNAYDNLTAGCDYLIDYYYIQCAFRQTFEQLGCDYLIDYYYIQYG